MVSIPEIDAFQSGKDTADFGVHVANAARNFTCGVFKNYPGAIIPNAADDFLVGLWSGFCQNSPTGLPTPASPPFNGGQCTFVYKITLNYTFGFRGQMSGQQDIVNVPGPVSSVTPNAGTAPDGGCYCWNIEARDNQGNQTTYHYNRGGGGPYLIEGFSYTVEPSNPANTDNCGNPGKQYPIVTPPSNYNVGPFNITLPGGGSAPANGVITVPTGLINITPQINITAQNPSLIGALNLSVDLGGIHINPGDGAAPTLEQIQALLNKFGNNIVRTPAPPPNSTTHDITPPTGTPGDAGKNNNLSGLDYVTIQLTNIPTSARVQFGNGTAPNVLIGAGWIEFSAGAIYFPRESITFATSQFKAPEGADGFAYTLSKGFLGQATSYQRKQSS